MDKFLSHNTSTMDHLPTNIIMRSGNLFDSGADTLVNTVNCVGVMGKGIALQFKTRYPLMFEDYVKRCSAGQLRPEHPYIWLSRGLGQPNIINFPTKNDWRNGSQLVWIDQGLAYLAELIRTNYWHVKSLAIPALGCANGGLNWEDVYPLIVKHLSTLKILVHVYPPSLKF